MIKLGDNIISKIYLGNSEISKAYLGDVQVYPTESPTYELTVSPESLSFKASSEAGSSHRKDIGILASSAVRFTAIVRATDGHGDEPWCHISWRTNPEIPSATAGLDVWIDDESGAYPYSVGSTADIVIGILGTSITKTVRVTVIDEPSFNIEGEAALIGVSETGASGDLTITSNVPWSIGSHPSWVTIVKDSNNTAHWSIGHNTGDYRNGTIQFIYDEFTHNTPVSQFSGSSTKTDVNLTISHSTTHAYVNAGSAVDTTVTVYCTIHFYWNGEPHNIPAQATLYSGGRSALLDEDPFPSGATEKSITMDSIDPIESAGQRYIPHDYTE